MVVNTSHRTCVLGTGRGGGGGMWRAPGDVNRKQEAGSRPFQRGARKDFLAREEIPEGCALHGYDACLLFTRSALLLLLF